MNYIECEYPSTLMFFHLCENICRVRYFVVTVVMKSTKYDLIGVLVDILSISLSFLHVL